MESFHNVCVYVIKWNEVTQLCLILCNPINCKLSGSSIHRIFQARVLERVAIIHDNMWSYTWDIYHIYIIYIYDIIIKLYTLNILQFCHLYLNKTKRKNKNEKNKDPNQFLKRKTPVSKMKIILELLIRHCRKKKLVDLKTAIETIQNETHRERKIFLINSTSMS